MELFNSMNWTQLREQKVELLKIAEQYDEGTISDNAIMGIVSLIDKIQDTGVEIGELERVVFGPEFDTIENALKEGGLIAVQQETMSSLVESIKDMLERKSETVTGLGELSDIQVSTVFDLSHLDDQ